MLYNSFQFIFIFLPIALLGYWAAGFFRTNLVQLSWLVLVSCVFYASWEPIYLLLLLGSIASNYAIGRALERRPRKAVLAAGIVFNLLILGYFKYRVVAQIALAQFGNVSLAISDVVLPLGISFFTFQIITYLVDVYRGRVTDVCLLRFATFVTFFPHLVAGPIVHYGPLMRQFAPESPRRVRGVGLGTGAMFFLIGLAKKVVIADNLAAPYSDRLFSAADGSIPLGFFEAWLAVFSYTFQVYFDFSGYSDMAIGLALMLGIRLPVNFNSPYKARSVIEFWRRWHITLSRFLREHVYIPLGGSHHGLRVQIFSVMVTMVLWGLWHGASWTFIIWGAVHGVLLVLNNLWRRLGLSALAARSIGPHGYAAICLVVTFLTVAVVRLLFRSQSLAAFMFVFNGVIGLNGFEARMPEHVLLHRVPVHNLVATTMWYFGASPSWPIVPITASVICASLLFVVWVLPNSQQIMSYRIGLPVGGIWRRVRWKPNAAWCVFAVVLFYSSLGCMVTSDLRPFVYFAF